MIIDKVKALLRPDVDHSVKLTGVGVFIGKTFDWLETRISDLEKRQLEKGDKGDSVTIEDVRPILMDAYVEHLNKEKEDLREIMAQTWRSW